MAAPGDLLALIGELFRPSPTPPPVPVSPTPDPAFAERERAFREELARRDANASGVLFGLGPNLLQAANSADPQEVFLHQFDPSLTYTDVFARGGEPSIADKVMGFGAGLAEPGPGELGLLDDILPLAASIPGFFRKLHRFADGLEISGERGARQVVGNIGDYTFSGQELDRDLMQIFTLLNRDSGRGRAGLAHTLRAADEEGITLQTQVGAFDPATHELLKGAARADAENRLRRLYERLGFENLPGSSDEMIRFPRGR